ncbi:MAG TPA: DMT family transporter, partial [Verrucomicrobiae bacterium]
GLVLDAPHLGVQSLAIVFGGVVPYALWNSALRHWQTSRVMLFNNFIPLTTTVWAHFVLSEPVTPTFCLAMILIVAGVALGQADWSRVFKQPESF